MPDRTSGPVARASAGASRPSGRNRPTAGIAATSDTATRASTPMPAAAAAEPRTVEARNVIAAQQERPSQVSAASATHPASGHRLEEDRGIDPADRHGEECRDAEDDAERRELRTEEPAARQRLRQQERRRPALLLVRHRAHREDDRGERAELAEVLLKLEDGIGRLRRRDRSGSSSPRAALRISGR